ncbi:MAG: sigma-70 family RNA polymerase sigma factor [Chitinophagaceae bacterium]
MLHADQRYIDALLANNYPVIEEIYTRFSPRITSLVLRNNGSEMDAADVFQDALLMICRKARDHQFQLTCPMEAFLYLVCRNRWLNELQKRKNRHVTIDEEKGFDIGQDASETYQQFLVKEKRRELLEEKLQLLDEGCRELLKLSWSGRPMEEIAGMLNFTYAYVRKKKSGCMAKLITLVRSSEQYHVLQW